MFFLLFLLDDGRIRFGSRIRISDLWIRIRTPEAEKHIDPTDLDPYPQHCSSDIDSPVFYIRTLNTSRKC
jgi:hypothetical protein